MNFVLQQATLSAFNEIQAVLKNSKQNKRSSRERRLFNICGKLEVALLFLVTFQQDILASNTDMCEVTEYMTGRPNLSAIIAIIWYQGTVETLPKLRFIGCNKNLCADCF